MNKERRFVVQENVGGRWITLAKIDCPDKTAAHLADLKAVAPELEPGQRYRVIREGGGV
ncbi:hypothetical protein [Zobellella iuensis]|uniref:Uncharacterized protein n=1 Tax=Zobellella iuensis TaxID=2803811 RepID=A0ABS1QNS5_9GAMM|nr:hypothetical protein [Zobellella iuensis]MBL1376267.1 hypothetical protein [Zobellella iuensis]